MLSLPILLVLLATPSTGSLADDCAGAIPVPPRAPDLPPPSPTFEGAGAPLIDIMLVYTPAARVAAGGTPSVQALVSGYVDSANEIYADSGVQHRLRLVHTEEVAYAESGNLVSDLARLKSPSDGFMDGVHALRDAFGADIVSLVTTEASAGTGYLMDPVSPSFEDCAFNAVGANIPPHVLAHEVGHNMGLNHNNPAGPATGSSAFCYSFGYRTPDDAWRSVMSSSPGQQAFLFSSPMLELGGFPFGIAGDGCPNDAADAVASMAGTDDVVAAFRPTVVPLDAFVDLGQGLAGTHGVPSLIGTGTLISPAPVTLALSGALENSSAALVIGLAALGAPFKGGTMVPRPDVLVTGLPTDGSGGFVVGAPWPPGLPAGFSTWYQLWIIDAAGPLGFSASNALRATTP